jgi:hypothetical protein
MDLPRFHSGDTLDRRKRLPRFATAWAFLTSPREVVPAQGRPLRRPALAPRSQVARTDSPVVAMPGLQAMCQAIATGFVPVESMARFYAGRYPSDNEQVDSVLSRDELAWSRDTCGMGEL